MRDNFLVRYIYTLDTFVNDSTMLIYLSVLNPLQNLLTYAFDNCTLSS
jgi:hypothetical protein